MRRTRMEKPVTCRVCGQPTGGQEAAKGLVILPAKPLPSILLYHPLHLTMTNLICTLSQSHRLPLVFPPHHSFSFPAVLIPFVIYAVSVSVSLTRTVRLCQARPWGSEAWQGVASVSPWWPNLEKPLNGFRHIC